VKKTKLKNCKKQIQKLTNGVSFLVRDVDKMFPTRVHEQAAHSESIRQIYLARLKHVSRFRGTLTSQRILKSFCSTLSSSQYSRVTTVECRGLSFSMDSPNAVPIPSVHSVTESCDDKQCCLQLAVVTRNKS